MSLRAFFIAFSEHERSNYFYIGAFVKPETSAVLLNSIKRLLQLEGVVKLSKIIARSHAVDLAHVFHFLTPQERRAFFSTVSPDDKAAELLTELEVPVLCEFIKGLDDQRLVRLLEEMSSDDTADILNSIDDEDRRELLLTMMHRDEFATTQSLLGHDPESAGGLMVPDYLALDEHITAGDAVKQLQEDAGRTEMVFYIYVTSEHGQLVGVLSLRELVLSAPARVLKSFMIPEVIRVSVETDQEEVAALIARYNLVALPVVDQSNMLVGVVTVDDIIDVIRLEATEDMMLMAGAGETQVAEYGGVRTNFRARLPWLVPTLVGGFVALGALSVVLKHIPSALPAAIMLPLVMMVAYNIAGQSAAIITRGLALEGAAFSKNGRLIGKEIFVGVLFALSFCAITSGPLYLLCAEHPMVIQTGAWRFMCACLSAQALSILSASTIGVVSPLIFAKLGQDPAVATGAFVMDLASLFAVLCFCSTLWLWL